MDDRDDMGGMAYAASTMTTGAGQPTRPVSVMTLVSFMVLTGGVALALVVRRS